MKIIWTIFAVLLLLWLAGLLGHIGGSLIHMILVIAVIYLVVNLLTGRRSLL